MRHILALLVGALSISAAHAHSLTVEKGEHYGPGDTTIPWEVATAHAQIRREDVGRPGAIFIGVTTETGRMMTLSEAGWEPFAAGTVNPAAVFETLPRRFNMFVFNTRDLDRYGRFRYDTGLSGRTLCEAAQALGTEQFAMAVGYGVLTEEAEATIARAQEVGSSLNVDHMRLAFVNNDMMANTKWNEVYRIDCVPDGGG